MYATGMGRTLVGEPSYPKCVICGEDAKAYKENNGTRYYFCSMPCLAKLAVLNKPIEDRKSETVDEKILRIRKELEDE